MISKQGIAALTGFKRGLLVVAATLLCISSANAAGVVHNQTDAQAPFADSVVVPPGYTSYYFSGTVGTGVTTAEQTASALSQLKTKLGKLGLNFGDVIEAHVLLAHAPDSKVDFAGMNSEWFKEFGTAAQPNKPTRSSLLVESLGPDNVVEIELIAAKKTR